VTSAKVSAERRFARAAHPSDRESRPADDAWLIDRIAASIRAEIPELAALDPDDITGLLMAAVPCGQAAVEERRPPTPQELDGSAAVTVALGRAGVPLDAINQSRRIAVRLIFDAWREGAQARGIDGSTQLEHLYSVWNWADAIAARASDVYPRAPEGSDGDEAQRASFLRGVLDGSVSPGEAQARAAAYGLLPGGRYMALRGRPSPGAESHELRRAIELSVGTESGDVLVGIVDGEVWGLVARRPDVAPEQGTVGLGTAAELGAVDGSFRLAGRALETATAFELTGVVGIDDLSLRPVIMSEDHLGDRLVRRYVEPLRELGDFGATLEHTVREYLANNSRIDDSAKALIIHPNTLRHRIDRFQQLTGADLHRTEDVIEVWWALERRRASPAPEAGGSPEKQQQ
jgi:PucR C-terminal helix-turn-helix domain